MRFPEYSPLRRSLVFAFVCLVAACKADEEPAATAITQRDCSENATAAAPVGEAGPFHVGYRSWDVTYDAPGGIGKRTIKQNVWYPTREQGLQGARYLGLFSDPDSQVDAVPAPPLSACGYPLAVYSHGHMGLAGGAAHIARRLASHGWVVAAPDHTGNTLADAIDPRPIWFHIARGADVPAVVDNLRDLPADDPLGKQIAVDRYVLLGHSYGGFSVWISAGATFDMHEVEERCAESGQTCSAALLAAYKAGHPDPRIVGIVPMAGTYQTEWYGEDGFTSVHVPVLQMSGALDPVGADALFALVKGLDFTWVEIAGACHEAFNLGGCEQIANDDAFGIVDTFALAFARVHLLGDRGGEAENILTGAMQVSNKVKLRKKGP